MRLSLTPPDSALPSPARPPAPAPAPRARAPRPALIRVHLRSTSPACAARRREGVSQRLLLRGSAPCRLAAASPASTFLSPPAFKSRSQGRQAAAHARRTANLCLLGRAQSGQEVAILRRILAVPPRPEGTGCFPKRRGDQKGPPLREERSFGWRAGQWEARTAAQRGAAAECKHSPARVRPRVSPRATRRACGTTGSAVAPQGSHAPGCLLALCCSPQAEMRKPRHRCAQDSEWNLI
ncbi:uncharacterized protein LOC131419404 [Diceros bicornis minor]|uniref:uncharacterized protein LOC131419404 n=1 Tax=Diceros bicornis minor TaxID=77932 RepID=UPI0026EE41BE|nr:uncharacterized protein LOC131419404 [Diceros bicornis minor]